MIRLIASDIDGTLVPDGRHSLPEEFFTLVRRLAGQGIAFAAASGREINSMRRVFAPVADEIYFISSNGALVTGPEGVISTKVMDPEKTRELIADMHKLPDCCPYFTTEDDNYTDAKNEKFIDWMVNGYLIDLNVVDDLLAEPHTFIKGALHHPQVGVVAAELIEKWKHTFYATPAGDMWVDFMDPSVGKGAALAELQQRLGVRPEETMAFGDHANDCGMFDAAYYSYAVANASPEALAAARFRTRSNVEGGVAEVLRRLAETGEAPGSID